MTNLERVLAIRGTARSGGRYDRFGMSSGNRSDSEPRFSESSVRREGFRFCRGLPAAAALPHPQLPGLSGKNSVIGLYAVFFIEILYAE